MLKFKNSQEGSSLVEALAILGIISLLAVSAIQLISNVYDVFKRSLAISELKDIQKVISGEYNFSGDYSILFQGNPNKILCEEDKSIPNQMCVKTDSEYEIRHRLSGSVIISPGSDMNSYLVKFNGLSKKNCVEFANINWLNEKKVDLYQLDINDVPVAYFPKKGGKGFPIRINVSLTNCSNDDNTITWYFY